MSKTLVAYFSASGTTKRVAERLADYLNADIFAIEPSIPYSNEDLNWTNKNSRSSIEMNSFSRPEIKNRIANIDDYDVIFVGYPIWWYKAPTIINTFLESYDLSYKTIIPFATSGGSGIGKVNDYLKASINDNVTLKDGRILSSSSSDKDFEKWLKLLNIQNNR